MPQGGRRRFQAEVAESWIVGPFPIIRRKIKDVDNLTTEQIGAEDYFRLGDNPETIPAGHKGVYRNLTVRGRIGL